MSGGGVESAPALWLSKAANRAWIAFIIVIPDSGAGVAGGLFIAPEWFYLYSHFPFVVMTTLVVRRTCLRSRELEPCKAKTGEEAEFTSCK
ncbi:hypothetical protein PCA10_12420 [Metapseudomonas resinovorans NBRC 106553]|uniref:Uncharacterized protein n=1 Tax=Metapseudomonas resinovorans NBRC 106553 TaxID=1245471 RepID=S6BD77_METRE|nr:hypothetical protein PCA10_12420 [Pseudomonas resinovorans NBRC 106553]